MIATWLIGNGLLGKGVVRRSVRGQMWRPETPTPWGSRDQVDSWFQAVASEFFGERGTGEWAVAWCAGAGVVGSPAATFDLEVTAFGSMLRAVGAYATSPGKVFLSSSIGAIHGGATAPPFTEDSPRVPISHYGTARALQEDLLREWCESTGHDGVIGRITNLYGPGQRLGKTQGLISQVCKSSLLRQPIRLYVSLDTTRDYLYVDDAGEMVLSLLGEPPSKDGGMVTIRILGSGASITVGGVLQVCERVLRRPLRMITVQSDLSNLQSSDLRVRPRAPIPLVSGLTALPVGVRRTFDDQLRQFQRGLLSTLDVSGSKGAGTRSA